MPLDRIGDLPRDGRPVVFHCKSGMRTAANATQLGAAAGCAPAYILDGGIDAWRQAEQPVVTDQWQPLEITRQVQITAGALVLTGVLLGTFVAPGFFGLSASVGAGLMFAGATGWCGMATCCASCRGTGAWPAEAIMDTAAIVAALASGGVISLVGGGGSIPSVPLLINVVGVATLVPRLVPIRLGVGLAAGFFGIGGGFLIVPRLILATAMPLPLATARRWSSSARWG